MESAPGARALISGRWRDYFSGTGYLGLQGHPGLVDAATAALRQYGLTTATSRGGYGEHVVFHSVEDAAARFLGEERALYTVSAYLGSGVLLQALRGEYDCVYVDESAHFSVREAVAASGAPAHTYAHCDPASLLRSIRNTLAPAERPVVLTDGVFPISGEIAPLAAYVAVLSDFAGAILCVDDAHATGVIGPLGRGSLEYCGVELPPASASPVRCHTAHTLSKALAGHGGLIGGSAGFVEGLWRNARALSGSSPSPIPAAAASAWSLNYVMEHAELRRELWANVRRCRRRISKARVGRRRHSGPDHLPAALGRGWTSHAFRGNSSRRDFCVAHITSYSSTPEGGALRVAVFATHTGEQIDRLVGAVEELL